MTHCLQSDDDVGAIPFGSQLPLVLLSRNLNHALQDQISDLKFPNHYLFVVCGPNLLLIGYDADLSLISPFLQVIQHQAE